MRTQTLYRPAIYALPLFVTLVMASFSVYLLMHLDGIVHGDLYRYNLVFSLEWANQYWSYLWLILGFIGVAMLIACASMMLILLRMWPRKIGSAKLVLNILLFIEVLILAVSMFFLMRLDGIVHGDLYRYNLVFSLEWANRYWSYLWLILGLFGAAIGMSGISFGLTFVSAPIPKTEPIPGFIRSRFKISFTRLTRYLLTSAGVITLVFSIIYSSSILAFIGLGLVFWGVILFYISPEEFVKETLLEKTTLPSLVNLSKIIKEIGYTGKGVYLPPKYFKGFESSKVYISAGKDMKLPPLEKTRDEGDKTFINNPKGALITSPGIELKRLFEKTLGANFTTVDLQYLEQNMPKLLVEDLEIAQAVEMKTENDKVFVKMENSIYHAICTEVKELSKTYCSLGCPLCSAIASALAEATGKSVVIEEEQTIDDDQTIKIEYRLLEEPLEEQTQK